MNSLLNMSLLLPGTVPRRSQRRRHRLAHKTGKQHQIPNPYRDTQALKTLPGKLRKQISKLEFLSFRSLQDINFRQNMDNQELADELLAMRMAARKQEQLMHRHFQKLQANCRQVKNLQATQASIEVKEQQGRDMNESSEQEQEQRGSSIMGDRYEEIELVFYSDHALHQVKEEYEHFLI